jgi:phosphoribosylanthranilate isomerase
MRIKICGVTTPEHACRAAELGADAVGLNFYPKSARHVTEETARQILRALPPFTEPVGLFVNVPLSEACQVLGRLGGVRLVQWHGDAHEVADVRPFRLVPAFAVRDADSLIAIDLYLAKCGEYGTLPAAILLDAHAPGQYGGTGQTAPWQLLADYRPPVPVILAGGLTPENVGEAVRLVRPFAVDVAGGVEAAPGKKDPEKMRRFIANAREAAARWKSDGQGPITTVRS